MQIFSCQQTFFYYIQQEKKFSEQANANNTEYMNSYEFIKKVSNNYLNKTP